MTARNQLELFHSLPSQPPACIEVVADNLPADPTDRMRYLMGNPRARLRIAEEGMGPLDHDDIASILGDHLWGLDRASKNLERLTAEWLGFVFAGGTAFGDDDLSYLLDDDERPRARCTDPGIGLDFAERLAKLHGMRLQELRRTAKLIAHITRPQPHVQLMAAVEAGKAGVAVQTIDLGECG